MGVEFLMDVKSVSCHPVRDHLLRLTKLTRALSRLVFTHRDESPLPSLASSAAHHHLQVVLLGESNDSRGRALQVAPLKVQWPFLSTPDGLAPSFPSLSFRFVCGLNDGSCILEKVGIGSGSKYRNFLLVFIAVLECLVEMHGHAPESNVCS